MSNVIETYSRLASSYETEGNLNSCWGEATQQALALLPIRSGSETVVEIGCGPGIHMASLVESSPETLSFVGVEPADNLRNSAADRNQRFQNAKVLKGQFENIPLDEKSADYIYSLIAFHWVTDLEKAVSELGRVLKDDGELDIIFSGKDTGKEFAKKTSPVLFKYLTPRQIMNAATSQQQLNAESTKEAFEPVFGARNFIVTESRQTYYDTLEGHWSWRCRMDGQFSGVPEETKLKCDNAIKEALATLETAQGIPYTIHLVHVKIRR